MTFFMAWLVTIIVDGEKEEDETKVPKHNDEKKEREKYSKRIKQYLPKACSMWPDWAIY